MEIDGKKYSGWRLEGISFDNETFTVSILSPSAFSVVRTPRNSNRIKAKILFSLTKKVSLSNVLGGAEIDCIDLLTRDQGYSVFVLKFSVDSYMEITAGALVDLDC